MQSFIDSPLIGAFIRAHEADITADYPDARYACCPIVGRTTEKDTALGRFRGTLSMRNLSEFTAALDDIVTENLMKAILDFQAATLSRSAFGVLVRFAATMHGRKKRLYIYRPSEQIRSSLADLGLADYFSYLESQDDILATLVV